MFVTSRRLAEAGFLHGFSTRRGGVSQAPFAGLNVGGSVGDDPAAVEENLRLLCQAAGLDRSRLRGAVQVHGDEVLPTGHDPLPPGTEADALLATEPGVAVSVKTADCVPVLVAARDTGEVAAVHAGWRGTDLEIVKKAVAALRERGAKDLLAAIGPSIGPCCYEVSPELADRFRKRFGPDVATGRHLDLPLANRRLLLEAGLADTAIDTVAPCTACNVGDFFSHRKEAGKTGRQLSFILSRERALPRSLS